MKKVFISVPMRGRTPENIKKSFERLHRFAEVVFDQPLELIQTYFEDAKDKDALVCLGKSLQLMSEADYFVGPLEVWEGEIKGCAVEADAFIKYKNHKRCGGNMADYYIGHFCPDFAEMLEAEAAKKGEEK